MLLAVGAALLLAAATALAQDEAIVVISDSLEPAHLAVTVGTTVTWRNEDGERHRMRSRGGPVDFDSGNMEAGESFTVTFLVAGTYPYLDERDDEDPSYVGTVVVSAAEASPGALPTSATVTIVDEAFHPAVLDVATGATVEWAHLDGDEEHTVTSSDGVFDSGVMIGGQVFSQTFDAPGPYPYVCAIHADMSGTIRVSGPDVEPTAAPATTGPGAEEPGSGGSDAAVAEAGPGEPDPAAASANDVSIVDLTFQQASIEVASGSTVTWSNDDGFPHTVTSTTGEFDSGPIEGGAVFSEVMDGPGTYDYFCAIHPSMTGTIVVTAAEGG